MNIRKKEKYRRFPFGRSAAERLQLFFMRKIPLRMGTSRRGDFQITIFISSFPPFLAVHRPCPCQYMYLPCKRSMIFACFSLTGLKRAQTSFLPARNPPFIFPKNVLRPFQALRGLLFLISPAKKVFPTGKIFALPT